MGIVVTVAMFIALIALMPENWPMSQRGKLPKLAWGFVLMSGLWNLFWYGLQNLVTLWGQAALVSGLALILAAYFIALDQGYTRNQKFTGLMQQESVLRRVVMLILTLSFLLYLVTLVQLNLGLPILG